MPSLKRECSIFLMLRLPQKGSAKHLENKAKITRNYFFWILSSSLASVTLARDASATLHHLWLSSFVFCSLHTRLSYKPPPGGPRVASIAFMHHF